jgi:arsenate reductase (glutaredoxin)
MIRVYEYSGCSTCRKALVWLDKKGARYEKVPIVEKPPTKDELRKMAKLVGGFRKLFNTSGLVYREMKLGEKVKTMTEDEAIDLLSKHGKLVKRPFVLTPRGGLVGFKEAEWGQLLR